MNELLIDKVIGEDWWEQYTGVSEEISARYVRGWLSSVKKDEAEIKIIIDSPGGDVFEGITIFNIIRDFARNNPDTKITTYIQGMAASMASVIALAANSVNPNQNQVVAEDNAVYMIHNAWDVALGNRIELREAADFLEQIDEVLRAAYVKRTGKSEKEITAMMDAETWLWGAEIKEAGFVDAILGMAQDDAQANNPKDFNSKNTGILSAKAKFAATKKTMEQVHAHAREEQRRSFGAAAMALGFPASSERKSDKTAEVASAVEHREKGGCMKITAEDVKRDNPEVYAQILADGEKAGAEKERARASRLLQLGEKSGAKDYALECVKNGSDPSDAAVVDAFFDKGVAARFLAAQTEDEKTIPSVNPPKDDKNADLKAASAAFSKALHEAEYGEECDGDY